MIKLVPERVYYEKEIVDYSIGKELLDRYSKDGVALIEIENHNQIPELRELPDSEFVRMKKYLILGIRRTTRLIPNNRSADFIVPFTSSGCSAMCLYCYLVCTFFKNSYLRVFVNRDEMMDQVRKKAQKLGVEKVYEIGCNSDMVLENALTGNLKWAVEEFAKIKDARCTFATKFAEIDDLLDVDHHGHTQMRISVNPPEIIKKAEIGTASLKDRIAAANKMYQAGYRIGINIAPIILLDDWKEQYHELIEELSRTLDDGLRENTFFELIFMTYGLANEKINQAALPGTADIFEKEKMKPKGRGKYHYKPEISQEAAVFFRNEIAAKFPKAAISYIV
ncbi:MAG: spore photoproduct lyase [Clostridia bacterium]|nr:spore photoproduct lyase [Clostridia bacterium]